MTFQEFLQTYSLEELRELLTTAIAELDASKSNNVDPEIIDGNRRLVAYIKKAIAAKQTESTPLK